jgi:hypothetical protein
MHQHCLICGREITDTSKSVGIIVIQTHSQKVGSAHIHGDCCGVQSLTRYMQVVEWQCRIANVTALRQLFGRIAQANGSVSGSVPLLMT